MCGISKFKSFMTTYQMVWPGTEINGLQTRLIPFGRTCYLRSHRNFGCGMERVECECVCFFKSVLMAECGEFRLVFLCYLLLFPHALHSQHIP